MLFALCCNQFGFPTSSPLPSSPSAFTITLHNSTNLSRTDEQIRLRIKSIQKKYSNFTFQKYEIRISGLPVYAEIVTDQSSGEESIVFNTNFQPHEVKTVTFIQAEHPQRPKVAKRAQAYIGLKTDYQVQNGVYSGGRFVPVQEITMTPAHQAHDALYQYEGPGWESDKIAYRFYLDSRNKMDIFGKKVNDMVMQSVGVHDLISDSKESYSRMMDWGMDIFKVGNSLGIGSLAYFLNGKVTPLAETDSVHVRISTNSNLIAALTANYYGWKVSGQKHKVRADISIAAGTRATLVTVQPDSPVGNFCTGLAKHENTDYLESPMNGKQAWGYIALYGNQALSGDDMGIAVFYRTKDLVQRTQDEYSRIVVLKQKTQALQYYFAAAWQQEKDGIKTKEAFIRYLQETIMMLSNPIRISY